LTPGVFGFLHAAEKVFAFQVGAFGGVELGEEAVRVGCRHGMVPA
jgi:hypothetical protein